MASRRDELRAYQFVKQRVVSALVAQETDPEQPPFRRPAVAAFWGLAVALIGLAIAGAIGLFTGGDDAPNLEAGKTVIIEKENGAVFVYLDGRLHPVANFSSALLALGDNAETQTLSRSQLVGIPAGARIGINGAPDALPATGDLLNGSWSMCTRATTADNGSRADRSAMLVGLSPQGGRRAGNDAMLVSSGGKQYYVWQGQRHYVTSRGVINGLNLATTPAVPVAGAWLDAIPKGTDLRPLSVPAAGGRSTALLPFRPQVRTGQIFYVQTSATEREYYLAQATRLAPLTPFQMLVQIGSAAAERAYSGTPRALPLSAGDLASAANGVSAVINEPDQPRSRPQMLLPNRSTDPVCATYPAGSGLPALTVGPLLPNIDEARSVGGRSLTGAPLTDDVVVPAGKAAFINIVANTESSNSSGTLALVTDDGTLYPMATRDVPKILGYDGIAPIRVSSSVASRLARGPSLNPERARQPV